MQTSGRTVVLSIFALALGMSGWAWWHHYAATKRMVEFWGPRAANLLVRGEEVDGYGIERGLTGTTPEYPHWPPTFAKLLGGDAGTYHDLTGAKGLIHLRHALTQDSSYDWDAPRRDSQPVWRLAFRFSDGDHATWVLLSDDLAWLGRPAEEGDEIDVLACPRMGPVLREYFEDIGVLPRSEADTTDTPRLAPGEPPGAK